MPIISNIHDAQKPSAAACGLVLSAGRRPVQTVGRSVDWSIGRSVGRSHLLNELREAGLIRQYQRQQRVRRGLHQLNRRFVKQQLAEELLEEVVQRRGVLRAGLEQRALRARAWGR